MRVCVVTPYDSNNFGAVLQAFALKRVLEMEGHAVVHLKTRSTRDSRHLFYVLRPSRSDITHPMRYLADRAFGWRKFTKFRRDLRSFIEVDIGEAHLADAVVVGSDEIWNVRHPAFRNPVFFGHGLNRTIAYAPSIGKATPADFSGHEQRVRDIEQIARVMVRDDLTAAFVEGIVNRVPPVVLDPTLLHDWTDIPRLDDQYLRSHRYVLVYAYGSAHLPVDDLRRYAGRRGLKVVTAGFQATWSDYDLNCSPLEFMDAVRRPECVLTTTFHGTIASVIWQKPFVTSPTSPKTIELLERLDLASRTLKSDFDAGMDAPVDFAPSLKVIERERAVSRGLLWEALSAVSAMDAESSRQWLS